MKTGEDEGNIIGKGINRGYKTVKRKQEGLNKQRDGNG